MTSRGPDLFFDGATILGVDGAGSWKERESLRSFDCDDSSVGGSGYLVAPRMNDPRPEPPRICVSGDGLCRWQELESRPSCAPTIDLNTITIRGEPADQRFSKGQNFFLDPFHALVNGRARRAETARRALLAQLCGGRDCPPQVDAGALPYIGYLESVIEPDAMTLPLGWHMPPSRIEKLNAVIVPDGEVEDSAPGNGIFLTMSENAESVGAIEALLDPDN